MADLSELLGQSDAMATVRSNVRRLLSLAHEGRRVPPVLILGETGTGKGLVAKLIHRYGPRVGGPFVDVNCAAIPETMLEAELFGYERGAFTDARHAKPGLFQTSNGGILFLDEVGVLPEALQAKLLTVIEERAVRRLGRTTKEPFDSWLISATNTDLVSAMRAGRFREDLYHRLAVLTLWLPSLRERPGDAVFLAERFLDRACRDYGIPSKSLSSSARDAIAREPWPGNVRELANVVERLALLSDRAEISADDLNRVRAVSGPSSAAVVTSGGEREQLVAALESTGWNIVRTAAVLGVARNTVRARMDRFGLRAQRRPRATASAPTESVVRDKPLSPPEPSLRSAPSANVRWDRRHVALLRVAFTGLGETPGSASNVLTLAAEKVAGFGGRIERLAAMVLDVSFGVVPVDNPARRAVSAALAIQRAITDDTRPVAARFLVDTDVTTVGHVVGNLIVEEAERAARTAVLDRLIDRVVPGDVYVTRATAPFLERHFELCKPTSDAPPDALLTVVRPETSDAIARRRVTPFVGRKIEMELLRSRFALARQGRGQLIGLAGDAGTGKSRLLAEFVRTVDPRATLVLSVGTSPLDEPTPARPIAAAVRALFAIDPADPRDVIREKIDARLRELELDASLFVPLVACLDLVGDDVGWTLLNPQQRARRMWDALRQVILRESVDQCVVIIVDDLQWMDADSQAALDHLIEGIPTASVLFVVAYRPEFRHQWGARTFYTQVPIGPLPASDASRLLDELLGPGASLATLKRQLFEWTEGNPFFVEEAIHALVAAGGLSGVPGRYDITGDVTGLTLPSTVEDVVASRIHRLPIEVGRVLQCAAVVGMEFSLSVAAAVAEVSETSLHETLRLLRDAELAYPTSDAREPTYRFRHAITHYVTYRSVPPEQQRMLHREVLRVMERAYASRLEDYTETLAEHAFRGESWEKAAIYLQAAGRRASARSATRLGIDYLQRAIIALDRAEHRRDLRERAIDVRLDLRYALMLVGQPEEALPRLLEAEEIAMELGDTHRLGRVVAFIANGLYLLGRHADAIDSARRAHEIAGKVDDFPTRVAADIYAGRALYTLGRYREGAPCFETVIDALRSAGADEYAGLPVLPAALARSYLAMTRSELGEFTSALSTAADAVAIAESTRHPDTIQWACYALGVATVDRGDAEGAIAPLERALALCRSAELPVYVPRAAAALGYAYVLAGRAEGFDLLASAVADSEGTSHRNIRARILARLAEVNVLGKRWRDGVDCAEHAVALARAHGERGAEAHALRVLAAAYAGDGRLEDGDTSGNAALVLAGVLGMRGLVARCHLLLATIARMSGRPSDARDHLVTASEMFEELQMTRWLPDVGRERQLIEAAGRSRP